jgi:hypothetical protein
METFFSAITVTTGASGAVAFFASVIFASLEVACCACINRLAFPDFTSIAFAPFSIFSAIWFLQALCQQQKMIFLSSKQKERLRRGLYS